MKTVKIRWEVADGYIGPSRPHYVEVLLEDIEDDMDDHDIFDVISEYVQDEFAQNVVPEWDYEEAIDMVKKALAAAEPETEESR